MRYLLFLGWLLMGNTCMAQASGSLGKALLFHASYDKTADADFARGDARIFTARSLKREEVEPGLHAKEIELEPNAGRYGGALALRQKTDKVIFYRGEKNVPYADSAFSGTICLWMRVSPADDLPAGYVDPLQITDKKWNDASIFVDFSKETPRQFRLGVFSDHAFWNPRNRPWETVPEKERPFVSVSKLPFARNKWTHVAITLKDVNAQGAKSTATLYLDGRLHGELQRPLRFSWRPDKVVVMLGIFYVGWLDDFAIFDQRLSAAQVKQVYELKNGVRSLR